MARSRPARKDKEAADAKSYTHPEAESLLRPDVGTQAQFKKRIRNRLAELNPANAEASLYRTRDLVAAHLMPDLARGRVLVTNWHVFEPQSVQVGGTSARVSKAGVEVRTRETITIGPKTQTARGKRYLTLDELNRQVAANLITVAGEERDAQGNLKRVHVESAKYVESDTALVNRVLGREVGGKQNVLVFNDEAHHAYRVRQDGDGDEDDEEDFEEFRREATVWIDGLDRIHKLRGINFCVDLSATPYYLAQAGQETNRPFPWVVSDFGLTDAIESGVVKIPQLAVRDTTGAEVPGYFNIWRWILPKLTASERGGRKGSAKPEAVLKYAHTPIAMLGGLWEEPRKEWAARGELRPPVFIIVCKSTKLAKVVFEWIAEDRPPSGIPPAKLEGFRNRDGETNTIRVDTKVVSETDSDHAKSDESAWMRFTLDTVGRCDWPRDSQGRPIYPEGFEDLAKKLGRPTHPPGRDVRCIVSVGMLTEGWDCNTVTHIVGLRPFLSQLLCEQVVGRALRRPSYDVGADGLLSEEVAKVLGVPFEVIPFKENKGKAAERPAKREHVYAVPAKAGFEITFPRVEGYTQAIRNRIRVDGSSVAELVLDPSNIPPEADLKGLLPSYSGRPSLLGPGRIENVSLNPYRARRRDQELVFDLARDLTIVYTKEPGCTVPSHVLFPQLVEVARRFLEEKVRPLRPADRRDVFLAPYYGWAIERLRSAIEPDAASGEAPEIARYETSRGDGSTAEVDLWTSREIREVVKSHLNAVILDTKKWEQQAAYFLDAHPLVAAFAKNAGLGFAIPYLDNGEPHDYVPDFIVKVRAPRGCVNLILETKGYDPLKDVKAQAARRWTDAVNAEGSRGRWMYAIATAVSDIPRGSSSASRPRRASRRPTPARRRSERAGVWRGRMLYSEPAAPEPGSVCAPKVSPQKMWLSLTASFDLGVATFRRRSMIRRGVASPAPSACESPSTPSGRR